MRRKIIWALIKNTFHKEYRNRMLIFSMITSVLVILGVNSLLSFIYSIKDPAINFDSLLENKFSIFYGVLTFWTWILSILIGIGGISSDFNYQVIGQILALPIERKDYLLGRLLGAWGIILAYFLGSLCLSYAVFAISTKEFTFNPHFLLSMLVSSFSFLVMITYSFLFSFLFSKVQAFIIVLLCAFLTYSSNFYFAEGGLKDLDLSGLASFKLIGAFFYTLTPRLGIIEKMANSLYSTEALTLKIPLEIGHFVVTYLLLFFVTYWVLKKKEI